VGSTKDLHNLVPEVPRGEQERQEGHRPAKTASVNLRRNTTGDTACN